MSTHARLERIFREVFNDESLVIRDDMTSRDIPGWDSLAHINLMFSIESEFDMRFVGNQLAELSNIGELKTLLDREQQVSRRSSAYN
jgi:acyl carrier protein